MGNLVTETPYSEVTATLKVFDRLGIDREGLKKFRKASSHVQFEVVRLMREGEGTKTEEPHASPFDHVGTLAFPGMPAFNTDSFFITKAPKDAKIKFSYVGPSFTNWFGGMMVEATQPSNLSLDRLRQDSNDPNIIGEIGEENCHQSLSVIRWHIESGWAKEDHRYAGYFIDKNGAPRAVCWWWRGHGWSVLARVVMNPYRWDRVRGLEFVFRKTLVA